MMSYAAPIAVSVILFISMLQPCPAPVIASIGILDAAYGAGLLGGGVVLGSWAAGHGASSVKPVSVKTVPVDNTPELEERQDLTPFEQCTSDGLGTTQTAEFPAHGSIIVANLPQSCMTWFDHYNLHPQIEELNKAHGTHHRHQQYCGGICASAAQGTVSRARRALVAASA